MAASPALVFSFWSCLIQVGERQFSAQDNNTIRMGFALPQTSKTGQGAPSVASTWSVGFVSTVLMGHL